ncbi:putative zinc-binding metallopeptidase [Pontibacter sp. E15-1]|uniref:zinc-binding metallopeptidase n=1 Tax=Pontibacter sp. E15-1 TaxID=2919918 RepID=UPI001F4F2256|nr:putative zinc-binding metallopeptidase [Pontibacter sp. E15-1]MCJ8166637.1 putative zinc-binding metallopeptidase [Pontibacter sp. E15-1]
MRLTIIPFLLLLLSVGLLASCSKDEDNPDTPLPGLGGETWAEGPTDTWLFQNFVVPYNIEVKYRFDRYEVALNKTLAPVREDKVIPVMETIRQTWINPYTLVAGENFIKTYAPKQFVLVGSAQYNTDGTIVLGTAEGGRKVILFVINDFDKKNKPEVKQMLHTIHHEFGHILHQTIMYPAEFKTITTDYTATWYLSSLQEARSKGYITEYARNNPDDDFVEMISIMLIEGKAGFDAIVASAPPAAQQFLRQKEQLVVRYYKEAWNIDFYTLQSNAQAAINAL